MEVKVSFSSCLSLLCSVEMTVFVNPGIAQRLAKAYILGSKSKHVLYKFMYAQQSYLMYEHLSLNGLFDRVLSPAKSLSFPLLDSVYKQRRASIRYTPGNLAGSFRHQILTCRWDDDSTKNSCVLFSRRHFYQHQVQNIIIYFSSNHYFFIKISFVSNWLNQTITRKKLYCPLL